MIGDKFENSDMVTIKSVYFNQKLKSPKRLDTNNKLKYD